MIDRSVSRILNEIATSLAEAKNEVQLIFVDPNAITPPDENFSITHEQRKKIGSITDLLSGVLVKQFNGWLDRITTFDLSLDLTFDTNSAVGSDAANSSPAGTGGTRPRRRKWTENFEECELGELYLKLREDSRLRNREFLAKNHFSELQEEMKAAGLSETECDFLKNLRRSQKNRYSAKKCSHRQTGRLAELESRVADLEEQLRQKDMEIRRLQAGGTEVIGPTPQGFSFADLTSLPGLTYFAPAPPGSQPNIDSLFDAPSLF